MTNEVINIIGVSKYYKLYKEPRYRLKEALNPFGRKYHTEFFALDNINLSLKKGEKLGIVGKNGSGKSTLLKIISGVLLPNTGTVNVKGSISALLELGAGFNPEFSGLENIYFYGTILGLNKQTIHDKLESIIEFADIGDYIHQPLKTYSSGMKSRLGFATAVHIEPDILIVDEVLAVGDAAFQKKSLRKMESLVNSGATVIIVSHSHETINRFCDRAIYLRDGRLLLDGPPAEVVKLYLKDAESLQRQSAEDLRRELMSLVNETSQSLNQHEHVTTKLDNSMYSNGVAKKSKPVITKNYPVELINICILNSSGDKVNIIEYGQTYKLVCTYMFSKPTENVAFPISFYNSKNFELYGIRHPNDGTLISIDKANSEVIVEYLFEASLIQNSYYFSVGVSQVEHDSIRILLRCEDILSFEVIQNNKLVHWGQVIIDTKLKHRINHLSANTKKYGMNL